MPRKDLRVLLGPKFLLVPLVHGEVYSKERGKDGSDRKRWLLLVFI